MIPMLAQVRVKTPEHDIRLWLPLFLVWLLLLILAVLLSPIILIACLIARLNPFTTVWGVVGVIAALGGTHIEVKAPDANVLVRIA
ncbi:MAG TPA: hypothetical protein VKU90_16820 [Caulobacteraceae bacterium]|jgi:hypothetical protein|nr:hypothetical protein [Caulobacteraceae bacterium]